MKFFSVAATEKFRSHPVYWTGPLGHVLMCFEPRVFVAWNFTLLVRRIFSSQAKICYLYILCRR